VVAFDEDADPMEDLIDSVESVEEEFDVHREPLAADSGSHPAVTDAGLVGGILLLNALIGGVEQYRADRAIDRLEAASTQSVLVRRGGADCLVDAGSLVAGDIVRLRTGDSVAADCRILEAWSLEVDESTLTGESLPVPKAAAASFAPAVADRTSMLYEATAVAAGEATAVVVATGSQTEVRSSRHLHLEPPRNGVEARLQSLTSLAGPVALGSGGVLGALAALRGLPLREVVESGRMLARTLDAGVPAAWVTGDEVSGADPKLRAELKRRGIG